MRYKLYKHQIETIKFFIKNNRCHCWNEAGTGKTASAIYAIAMLLDYYKQRQFADFLRVLIICTKSTMLNVWGREFFNLFPRLTADILEGTKQQRIVNLYEHSHIKIINHDGVKVIANELIDWEPTLVIIDESTAVKNARTERFKVIKKLCAKAKRVWLLTGTPTPQSPLDLYGQGLLVNPDGVGFSFLRFRNDLMYQAGRFNWIARREWEQIALSKIGAVIRYARNDCLDLPAVTYNNYNVDFSTIQQNAFHELRKNSILKLQKLINEGLKVTAVHEGVIRTKLLQICCGYVYADIDEDCLVNALGLDRLQKNIANLQPDIRLETTLDLINECQRGVLIFVPFRSAIFKVYEYLQQNKIPCAQIYGDVSNKLRTNIFDEFQDGKIKAIVAHPRTMGHGVTLTHADTVIWYCVTSDNEIYEQANARINRIGQENKMRVIHLLSSNFENAILNKLQKKQQTQQSLLDMLQL